ncbi:MAG: hypothetical protein ACUVTU_01800 [Desulfurispora sp.]|uniref:hypothetical protein n=1 Tax=Desulfurispora sp. TaxID=3014275 RepID=UPI0040499A35
MLEQARLIDESVKWLMREISQYTGREMKKELERELVQRLMAAWQEQQQALSLRYLYMIKKALEG